MIEIKQSDFFITSYPSILFFLVFYIIYQKLDLFLRFYYSKQLNVLKLVLLSMTELYNLVI